MKVVFLYLDFQDRLYWNPSIATKEFASLEEALAYNETYAKNSEYKLIGYMNHTTFSVLHKAAGENLPQPAWKEYAMRVICGHPEFHPYGRFTPPVAAKPRREPDHAPNYWDLPPVTEDTVKKLGNDYMAAVRASSGDKRERR